MALERKPAFSNWLIRFLNDGQLEVIQLGASDNAGIVSGCVVHAMLSYKEGGSFEAMVDMIAAAVEQCEASTGRSISWLVRLFNDGRLQRTKIGASAVGFNPEVLVQVHITFPRGGDDEATVDKVARAILAVHNEKPTVVA